MSPQTFEERLEKLVSRLRASSIEAVVLSSPANVYYFTGVRHGVLTVSGDGVASIFSNAPVNTPLAGRISIVEKLGRRDLFSTALEYIGDRRMTIGYDIMTVDAYQSIIKSYPSFSLTSVKDIVYEQRQTKTPREVELLKKASSIVCTAVDIVREMITDGTTPSDIRRAIADTVYRSGADLAFNPRVSIGDDTFLQSDSPPNHGIRRNQLIRITASAAVEGYVAYVSRTFYYGEKAPDKLVKNYQQLLKLKEYIKSLLGVWSSAVSIYDRGRAYALEIGLEPATLTTFGKGVGIEEEEPPFIQSGSPDLIREGTVLSIGPDLLLPGRYGLSFSDIYHVTAKNIQQLTDAKTDLEIL
ncbi:MAG: M24 family metallopeptidase [Candidatus Caldarchaeum sp.]|nr:M24 family metallopeptidase [Candidatus Caldarchaeum sp.]MDW8436035.1 M24 family metallopeptidase [Candidatus Caldarchaeum sp.]